MERTDSEGSDLHIYRVSGIAPDGDHSEGITLFVDHIYAHSNQRQEIRDIYLRKLPMVGHIEIETVEDTPHRRTLRTLEDAIGVTYATLTKECFTDHKA